MRGATVEVHCKSCGTQFTARVADRKRGWGKYCSKSCKAKKCVNSRRAFADYMNRDYDEQRFVHVSMDMDEITTKGEC